MLPLLAPLTELELLLEVLEEDPPAPPAAKLLLEPPRPPFAVLVAVLLPFVSVLVFLLSELPDPRTFAALLLAIGPVVAVAVGLAVITGLAVAVAVGLAVLFCVWFWVCV